MNDNGHKGSINSARCACSERWKLVPRVLHYLNCRTLPANHRFVPCVLHYLGYGITHAIALEGALKLKEITYAHCEGMFSSEFKHGPLSAVHDGYPVVLYTAPGDESMMINHVNEVTVRGGRTISVAVEHEALRKNVHDYLVLPAQLISYHMSVARGIDPDFPRNLSKTLTVN
jgi:glucosamine--fructose-6-phosphate aminotransferase (isomerizing)